MKTLFPFVVAAALAAAPAAAEPLIGFTDTNPDGASLGALNGSLNRATSWTQTTSVTDARLEVLVYSRVGMASANWWLTTALGPTATPADVVASGTYSAPELFGTFPYFDFNDDPYTLLATGLTLDAATYHLVLDGPAGPFANSFEWIGDGAPAAAVAPGFALGGFFFASAASDFGPSSSFAPAGPVTLAYRLSTAEAVPEPGALGLLGLGVLGAAALRRRRT